MIKNKYVQDQKDHLKVKIAAEKFFTFNAFLPEFILISKNPYVWINGDDLYKEIIFDFLQKFSKCVNDQWWAISVVSPSPIEYFYHHFECYPTIYGSDCNDYLDYINAANSNPGNSPADAIIHNCDQLIAVGASEKWAIYVDRDLELGIFSFCESVKNKFYNDYPLKYFSQVDDAAKEFSPLSEFKSKSPSAQKVYSKLLSNFQ